MAAGLTVQLRELLLKAYRAPLSLRDVSMLAQCHRNQSSEAAPYSAWTYCAAYEWLEKTQLGALTEALVAIVAGEDLDRATGLFAPGARSDKEQVKRIRGVRVHSRVAESCILKQPDILRTVAGNPPTPPVPPTAEVEKLIPGFETTQAHQRQIYAAVASFYQACKTTPGFQGLILYGQAGTGKTMACQAMIAKLAEEGSCIWQTDFHAGEALLTIEEQQELLIVHQQHGYEIYLAALTEKFKARWQDTDVFFVDDTNEPHSVLADVSNAAMRYARQTGKKIVITSNQDPIQAFSKSMTFPIDSVVLRHIEGPDHRVAHAWHPNLSLDSYTTPATMADGHPLTASQQNMHRHLQALRDHPGHNGVAFYGPPGIGKTTLLREFFTTHALSSEWIESHTLTDDVDLKAMLAESDKAYLVIDDCNDPQGNWQYRQVLFSLLNNEVLLNKNGEPVRVVLISNRSSWEALVEGTVKGASLSQDTLTPRMTSRYHGRFASVSLPDAQDFRADGAKRGAIVRAMPSDAVGASVLGLRAYLTTYSELTKQYGDLMAGSTIYGRDSGITAVPGFDKGPANAVDAQRKALEQNQLNTIASSQSLILDMRGIDLEDRSNEIWGRPLIQQALDTMESKPDYRLTIVADDPEKAAQTLQKWMAGIDGTNKYVSRLQRLEGFEIAAQPAKSSQAIVLYRQVSQSLSLRHPTLPQIPSLNLNLPNFFAQTMRAFLNFPRGGRIASALSALSHRDHIDNNTRQAGRRNSLNRSSSTGET